MEVFLGKSSINDDKWEIFHCQVWIPEGNPNKTQSLWNVCITLVIQSLGHPNGSPYRDIRHPVLGGPLCATESLVFWWFVGASFCDWSLSHIDIYIYRLIMLGIQSISIPNMFLHGLHVLSPCIRMGCWNIILFRPCIEHGRRKIQRGRGGGPFRGRKGCLQRQVRWTFWLWKCDMFWHWWADRRTWRNLNYLKLLGYWSLWASWWVSCLVGFVMTAPKAGHSIPSSG